MSLVVISAVLYFSKQEYLGLFYYPVIQRSHMTRNTVTSVHRYIFTNFIIGSDSDLIITSYLNAYSRYGYGSVLVIYVKG